MNHQALGVQEVRVQQDDDFLDPIGAAIGNVSKEVTGNDLEVPMGRDVAPYVKFLGFAPLYLHEAEAEEFQVLIYYGRINFPLLHTLIVCGAFFRDANLCARILKQAPNLETIKIDNGCNSNTSCDLSRTLLALEEGMSASGQRCPDIIIETEPHHLQEYLENPFFRRPLRVVELRLREFRTMDADIISYIPRLQRLHIETNFLFDTKRLISTIRRYSNPPILTFTAKATFTADPVGLTTLAQHAQIKLQELRQAGIRSTVSCLSVDTMQVTGSDYHQFFSAIREFGRANPGIQQLTLHLRAQKHTYDGQKGAAQFDQQFYFMMSAFTQVKVVQLFGSWNRMSNVSGCILTGIALNCRKVTWLSLISASRDDCLVVDVPNNTEFIDQLAPVISFNSSTFVMFPLVTRLRIAVNHAPNSTRLVFLEFMRQHFPLSNCTLYSGYHGVLIAD